MKRGFDLVARVVAGVMLAYPLSGCTLAIGRAFTDPSFAIRDPVGFIIWTLYYVIATPLFGGFPPTDEGGVHHRNMYPWIVTTALALFFFSSKGWRWFKRGRD